MKIPFHDGHPRPQGAARSRRHCYTEMASNGPRLSDCEFDAFLSTLLDDVAPTSSVQAVPLSQWQGTSSFASSTEPPAEPQQLARADTPMSESAYPMRTPDLIVTWQGQAATAEAHNSNQRGTKRAGSITTLDSKCVQQRQLQAQLCKQQEQLRQQLHQKLCLTERATMLEQLIQVRNQNEQLVAKIKAGLTYNPFAVFDTDVKSFMRTKPDMLRQRFITDCKCFSGRLAMITPLLQKYPNLCTSKAPIDVLMQLTRELSLAEPTNPYGADGLPVGSFTSQVPEKVTQMFAAAYQLDLASMSTDERAMLETCAVLVVEKWTLNNAYWHAFLMLPEMHFRSALHVDATAGNPSWEDLTATLCSMTVDDKGSMESSMPGDAASTTVASEGHWRAVVANLGLTDKQRLQALVLWEFISKARAAIHKERAQFALQLSQLRNPAAGKQVAQPMRAVGIAAQHPAQVQQQQGLVINSTSRQQDSSHQNGASAIFSMTREQLTQQEALMQRLTNTLDKERSLMNLASCMLYGSMLGTIQACKVLVYSHPFFPAQLDILAACAAECTPAVMDALVAVSQESN